MEDIHSLSIRFEFDCLPCQEDQRHFGYSMILPRKTLPERCRSWVDSWGRCSRRCLRRYREKRRDLMILLYKCMDFRGVIINRCVELYRLIQSQYFRGRHERDLH
jgi:hypothetical protein